MNIKIQLTKKTLIVLAIIFVIALVSLGCWLCSATKARHDIKASCQERCECFSNVVDYRLTDERARLFARFIRELQKRKDANVLEFMDMVDALSIQKAFSVCQPQVAPVQEAPEQPLQAKKTK